MRKSKCFLSILMTFVLLLSTQLTSFAQKEIGTAESGDKKIETALVAQEQEENTAAYDKIYAGLLECEELIDLTEYHLTDEEAIALYQRVVNDNWELFYVGSSHFVYCDYDFEGWDFENWDDFPDELIVTGVYPFYGAEKEEIEPMKVAFRAAMDEALSGIDESMTDLEKALYLHDYIIKRASFDWIGYQAWTTKAIAYTAYGCLVNGVTSTSGYALAYSYLLKEVGIESQLIDGYTHTWNAIKLGGNYYYVDLHCDNPIKHSWGQGCAFDCVEHAYFLLGEEELMERSEVLSHAWDHNIGVQVNRTSYEPFPFRKVSGPICYYKGSWYYWRHLEEKQKNPAIMKTDDLRDVGTPIHSLDGFHWYTMDTGKIWKGYNGNIDVSPERGKLYYCNSRQILSLNLEDLSAQPKLVSNVDVSEGYIYGLKLDGDRLVYGTAETPYYEEDLDVVDLDATEEKDLMIGDLDGNGKIESSDALMLLKRDVQLQVDDFEEFLADCDGDGKITSEDALWILKKDVGLI